MLKNPHWAKDMKWDDEPIAITVPEFVAGKSDIVLVIHDPGHGGWQFTDGQEWKGRKPKVIPKAELLRLDPSLAEVKDLPVGWQAKRAHRKIPGFEKRSRLASDGPPNQHDLYPASWALPVEEVRRAIEYFEREHQRPPFVVWHED